MEFYFDTRQKSLYTTSNRNGSTIMKDISAVVPTLCLLHLDEVFELLQQDILIPIYIPFRDPEIRFRSGLSVNFFNLTGKVLDDYTDVEPWANKVKYLRDTLHDTGTYYSAVPNETYHLFDTHLDHWLWVAMIMGTYGYNVKLLPMYDLTEHLRKNFPDAEKLINNRARSNSFDKSTPLYEKIWGYYKKVMIDEVQLREYKPAHLNKPEPLYTFDDWMSMEVELFNNYKKFYKERNLRNMFTKMSRRAFEHPFYFSDVLSPRMKTICGTLLPKLHRYHKPLLNYGDMQDLFREYDYACTNIRYKKYHLVKRENTEKKDTF